MVNTKSNTCLKKNYDQKSNILFSQIVINKATSKFQRVFNYCKYIHQSMQTIVPSSIAKQAQFVFDIDSKTKYLGRE